MQTIRAIRLELGFSIGEMAESLGLQKATYQGYDNGTRKTPDGIYQQAVALQKSVNDFMAEAPQRIDARLNQEFPHGIMSEVQPWV